MIAVLLITVAVIVYLFIAYIMAQVCLDIEPETGKVEVILCSTLWVLALLYVMVALIVYGIRISTSEK